MTDEPSVRAREAATLERKVAFLSRPEAYPERPRRVETKETHMSWVFLADAHAYKLKKPVRYAFLDFSTVEARRRDCEAEVRLNRRLAPDVYLGTVALAAGPEGLRLAGDGTPVDWLVKMRRLPGERTLEHAIEAGALEEADVRAAAARLARFYRDAAPVPMDAASYRRRFADDIAADRRELLRPAFAMPADAVGRIAEALLGFVDERGALLDARAEAGRIVEAHGDLRPEHVYLLDPPVILDCLEFKRAFRLLDPADELAFLVMECDRLGATAVQSLVFETYREVTGDAPPAPLVHFYKSYRAFLRAKIAVWHLDEPEPREPEKWTARARDYLRLAARDIEAFDAPGA